MLTVRRPWFKWDDCVAFWEYTLEKNLLTSKREKKPSKSFTKDAFVRKRVIELSIFAVYFKHLHTSQWFCCSALSVERGKGRVLVFWFAGDSRAIFGTSSVSLAPTRVTVDFVVRVWLAWRVWRHGFLCFGDRSFKDGAALACASPLSGCWA